MGGTCSRSSSSSDGGVADLAGIVVPNLGELSVSSVLNRKVVLSLLSRL